MPVKGYHSKEFLDNEDLTQGEITSLPFGSNTTIPFSIKVVPRADLGNADLSGDYPLEGEPALSIGFLIFLDCKLLCDEESSPLFICEQRPDPPFWTKRQIIYIPDTVKNQQLLELYRVFWRAGEYSPIAN